MSLRPLVSRPDRPGGPATVTSRAHGSLSDLRDHPLETGHNR
jgi:hypothetical protein